MDRSDQPSGEEQSQPTLESLQRLMAEFPDMNPGPVLRLRMDGTIEMLNRAAKDSLNLQGAEGECWYEVCPEMDMDTWEAIQSSPEPVQFEAGTLEQCFLYTHVCRPDTGNIFVYGADVTAHRLAEKALEDQRAQMAEMARFPDMNPGPVIRFVEDGSIVLANRAARRLFDKASLVGLKWRDVCPGMTEALWDRISTTTSHVLHEAHVGDRVILFTHTPRTPAGNSFVYGSDVTEQKEAERLLAQSEKMATLGTLSAGVAHELNNPAAAAHRGADHLRAAFTRFQQVMVQVGRLDLTEAEFDCLLRLDKLARERSEQISTLSSLERMDLEQELEQWLDEHQIPGGYELLDDLVEGEISSEELNMVASDIAQQDLEVAITALARSLSVYRLLQEIGHGTERISSIVGALKEYSYLDQAPIQEVDVNKGIRNTLIILNSKLSDGIDVADRLDEDLPHIHAYGSELNQVWTNLIDNAIGAMKGEGVLTVLSREVEGGVEIQIEDSGPGIPEEIQHRVFDAFFTTKAPGEGTGLGLHTCYSIVVNKHQGSLTLTSEPEKTCFLIRLPASVQENE